MATSRTPGASSLNPPSSQSEAVRTRVVQRLSQIVSKPPLTTILQALAKDAAIHVVGGTVRDAAEETESAFQNTDLDLATILRPEVVLERLNHHGIHTIATGLKHGTITAVIDEHQIEITTFRQAGRHLAGEGYSNSIETDLTARDFTINACAFDATSQTLVDPFGGFADLIERRLRAVGAAADRFKEDPLRILRAVRFGPAAGRVVDSATTSAAKLQAGSLTSVSVERIKTELEKIILSPHPDDGMRTLSDWGLLPFTFPEMLASVGFEQNEFHRLDVFEHTLEVVKNCPPNILLRLSALFHDCGKPASLTVGEDNRRHFFRHEHLSTDLARIALERLRFSQQLTQQVTRLVRYHMRPFECGPAATRRLMRDLDQDLSAWVELKRADALGAKFDRDELESRIAEFEKRVAEERNRSVGSVFAALAVNGEDLKVIGIHAGPGMGKILSQLRELVLDNPDLNTRAELLERARALNLS
jgi:tRNA nucleotidyltransferase (CCA-adding enzyme)